jgi:hypothetical protein
VNSGAAYQALRRAIKDGYIKRETTCQLCGIDCEHQNIDAHHHNGYDDPLNVWWVCTQCNTRIPGDEFHTGGFTLEEMREYLQDKFKGLHGYCQDCNRKTSKFYEGNRLVRFRG